MTKEGSKRVEVVGLKDKRQITAVFLWKHERRLPSRTTSVSRKDYEMSSHY